LHNEAVDHDEGKQEEKKVRDARAHSFTLIAVYLFGLALVQWDSRIVTLPWAVRFVTVNWRNKVRTFYVFFLRNVHSNRHLSGGGKSAIPFALVWLTFRNSRRPSVLQCRRFATFSIINDKLRY
jgi:hypothetical protein